MSNVVKGQRPDLTPAQIVAVVLAGIPIVSNLLAAYNVVTVNAVQQEALADTVTWGGVVAGLLIGGDLGLRAVRNRADSKVEAAALIPASTVPPDTVSAPPLTPAEVEEVEDEDGEVLDGPEFDPDADAVDDDDLPAEEQPPPPGVQEIVDDLGPHDIDPTRRLP